MFTLGSVHGSLKRYVVQPLEQLGISLDVAAFLQLYDARYNISADADEVESIIYSLGARRTRVVTTPQSIGVERMWPALADLRTGCPWVAISGRCETVDDAIMAFRTSYLTYEAYLVLLQLMRHHGKAAHEPGGESSIASEYDWVLRLRADYMWLASVPWGPLLQSPRRVVYLAQAATPRAPGVSGNPWAGLDGTHLVPAEHAQTVCEAIPRFLARCRAGNASEIEWPIACNPEMFLWRTTLKAHLVPFQMHLFPTVPRRREALSDHKWSRFMCYALERARVLEVGECMSRINSTVLWRAEAPPPAPARAGAPPPPPLPPPSASPAIPPTAPIVAARKRRKAGGAAAGHGVDTG